MAAAEVKNAAAARAMAVTRAKEAFLKQYEKSGKRRPSRKGELKKIILIFFSTLSFHVMTFWLKYSPNP